MIRSYSHKETYVDSWEELWNGTCQNRRHKGKTQTDAIVAEQLWNMVSINTRCGCCCWGVEKNRMIKMSLSFRRTETPTIPIIDDVKWETAVVKWVEVEVAQVLYGSHGGVSSIPKPNNLKVSREKYSALSQLELGIQVWIHWHVGREERHETQEIMFEAIVMMGIIVKVTVNMLWKSVKINNTPIDDCLSSPLCNCDFDVWSSSVIMLLSLLFDLCGFAFEFLW